MPPSKSSLREKHLAARSGLAAADHARLSVACCKRLCTYIEGLEAIQPVIAFYHPIRHELDVLSALDSLKNKAITALPVSDTTKKLLSFRQFEAGDRLMEGRYGILTPSPDAKTVVPDIVIVPLLAFDRAGHRLGYGAGFYDATLSGLRYEKSVLAIGVAFAMQEADSLPSEPHDEPLDLIVTDKETITTLEVIV